MSEATQEFELHSPSYGGRSKEYIGILRFFVQAWFNTTSDGKGNIVNHPIPIPLRGLTEKMQDALKKKVRGSMLAAGFTEKEFSAHWRACILMASEVCTDDFELRSGLFDINRTPRIHEIPYTEFYIKCALEAGKVAFEQFEKWVLDYPSFPAQGDMIADGLLKHE